MRVRTVGNTVGSTVGNTLGNTLGKFIIPFLSLTMLIATSGCTTKRKELVNKVDPAAYVARADYEGKTFHFVKSIEDADGNNDVYAVPGLAQDYGLVTTRITDTELQFISAFDPQNRAETMTVIAAYPITSHFDIVREQNDYKENTHRIIEEKEKPWKQRAFMRVDWARPTIQVSKLKTQLGDSRLEEEGVTLLEGPSKDKQGNVSWLTETSVRGPYPFKAKTALFLPDHGEAANSFRVTYRTYLMPVQKSDFQPVAYSTKDFSRFGYFSTEHRIEDPYRGMLDKNIQNYAEVYNVCEPGTGRSCSTNKIVWLVNKGFPKAYLNAARTAVDAWNEAFQKALGRHDRVVELDLSREVDFADPTVNVIGLYDPRQSGGLLGVAQGVVDPRTGEKLASRATVYNSAVRSTVAWVDEMIDVLVAQDPLTNVIGASAMGPKQETTNAFDLANTKAASENLRRVLHIQNSNSDRSFRGTQGLVQQLNASASNSSARRTAFFQSPRAAAAMAIPELTALADITGGPISTGSPLAQLEQTGNPLFQGLDSLMQIGTTIRSEKAHFLRQADLGIHEAGMVEEAAERFLLRYYAKGNKEGLIANREKIKARVGELVFYTTLLHEMGHAFGLRHNFQASADRKHYHANYEKVSARVEAGDRSFTKADLDPYMYSSVMDYGADFFNNAGSLGPYDVAAIRYAYNRSIDRENDPQTTKQNFFFCTDQQVGETVLCQRHDKGSNVSQIVKNTIDRYERTYFLNHFRRGRANFEARARGYTGYALRNTMIPVRRVMDEYFWMVALASENAQPADGHCGMKFIDASISRGEIANVCDPRSAVVAAADPEDMSTWFRALRQDKVAPEDYIPYGAADLLYANELAKQFFQTVLGSTEPGYYVVIPPSKKGELPKLKKLPGEGSNFGERVKMFAASLDIDKAKIPEAIKEVRELSIPVSMGEFAKPFYMTSSFEAGNRKLNSIGSVYDKIAAMVALSLRDIGISKFRDLKQAGTRGTLAGNPYVYPQTRSFVSAVFGNLVVGEPSFVSVPVNFSAGVNAGKTFPVALPAATNPDLQTIASILGITEMVFPFDQSMLSKLRVCTVDDQGCLTRLSENKASVVKFRSSDYSTEYRTFQTEEGDSIAYAMVAKAKELDDARRKLESGATAEADIRDETLRKLTEAEPLRTQIYENLQKVSDLSDLVPLIGKQNDASEWSKVRILVDRASSISPGAITGLSVPLMDRMKAASKRIDEKLANSVAADPTRPTLEELSRDFHTVVELFDQSVDKSFSGRDKRKMISQISEKLSLIEANIRLIHSITKVLDN